MHKGKRDFEKDVQEFRDHIQKLLRTHKLSKIYSFVVGIIDPENFLVEISIPTEILRFLEKRTDISFAESQLQAIGEKQNAFHKTEGKVFLLKVADGKIIVQGNFGLPCLSYALADFFSKRKDFVRSMHIELEEMLREKMPLLLSKKRTLSTSCQKGGTCKVIIRLNPIVMSLDGHSQHNLTEKSERICNVFQYPIESHLKIDSGNGVYVGKLTIVSTITVTGKNPAEIVSKIHDELYKRPDFKYLTTKI
ncbi:MAG: hypothetical protein Q7T51_02280 [Candidatus Moranbacteria bacterium]|nr:hypothetical protein [Candidatus Moranbacteria bacterium]